MDLPIKPKPPAKPSAKPPAARRPKKNRSVAEERQAAALAKIAKTFRRVRVADRRKGPQFLAVLLSLLGVALVLYKIFGSGFWKSETVEVTDVAPEATVESPAPGPIDPRPFRQSIETFERVLLGEAASPALDGATDAILGAGAKLAGELQLDNRSEGSKRAAQELQGSLDRLAARKPPQLEDFAQLRQEWLTLRKREFLAVSFFLGGAEAASSDQLGLAAYRGQLSALDQALNNAFDRVAALSREPEPGEESPEERQRRLAAIDVVAGELRLELDQLRNNQPERPSGNLAPGLMIAIQSLEQALAESRALAGSAANLTPTGRASFGNVQLLIDRTREALEQLER